MRVQPFLLSSRRTWSQLFLSVLFIAACSDDPTAPVRSKVADIPSVGPRANAFTSSAPTGISYAVQFIPMRRAFAISDNGVIAGDVGANNVSAVYVIGSGLRVIGHLDRTTSCCSSFNDVNSSGEVVGWSNETLGTIPLRYSVSSNLTFDPGVGGELFGQGINAAGDIVGGEWPVRAVYKPNNGPAIVLANGPGISGSYAFDLNASGMIVGDAFIGPNMVAVMWTSPSAAAQSLGTLGGASSRAWQVNDIGEIVGVAETAEGFKHAFLWTSSTGMIDLATWANSCSGDSEAFAINNNGVIAGRCNGRPVLWTGSQGMILLPGGSGQVTDINNLNVPVGTLTSTNGVVYWKIIAQPPVANHGGPYSGAEGSSINFDGSASTDPENGALSYAWTFGDGGTATGATPTHSYTDNGTFAVTLTVTDPTGLTSTTASTATVSNVAPTITTLIGPTAPYAVGATVSISGTFTDPGSADTHLISVDWDANGVSTVTAGQLPAAGQFAATHSYSSAGVYTVAVTVTDDDNAADTESYSYIVVYDPSAGFVTGGGWFNSPAAAYSLAPDMTGRANFGFVSRYQKGKVIPSGETEFQFRAANLTFQSSSYDWLVIAGRKAQYKGVGTINGAGDYGFMLTAEDGNLSGGDGKDRVRIKIWNRNTGQVVYDNQFGDSDDSNASTVIGGGSIVIHQK